MRPMSELLPTLAPMLIDADEDFIAAQFARLEQAERAARVCSACTGLDMCGLGTGGVTLAVTRIDRAVLVQDAPCRYLTARRVMEKSLSSSTLGKRFRGRTFETWIPLPGTEGALRAAREAAEGNGSRGVCLTGKQGTGKSHLVVALFWRRVDRGRYTLFHDTATLFDKLRRGVRSGEIDALMDSLTSAESLILDDIDKITAGSRRFGDDEELSGFVREKLFRLINDRYEADLQTSITCNSSLNELADMIGGERMGKHGAAIVSKITEMCACVDMDAAADYRLKLARGDAR